MSEPVPRWSPFTKRAVTLIILLLVALVAYRFRSVLPPVMIALLLAFILNPVVGFLTRRLHIARGLATALVFLLLILAMLGVIAAPVTAVPSIARFVRSTQIDTIRIINSVGAFFEQPLVIGDYSLDLSTVYKELSAMLTSFVRSVAEGTLDAVVNIASGAFWLISILIGSFYLVKDAERLSEHLDNLAPPGYRDDFIRLRQQIGDVWNAFLRGQLLLSIALATMTTVTCWLFGLSYAGLLGLLAGLMEFVPNLGPIIAMIPAVVVALFQDTTLFGLSSFWYAVLIAGLYIVIQQIEGNFLVPRILGRSLDLHPLVVLVGIIVGGSMGGILGILLAAPVLATLRVISYYVFCRLYDRDPFLEPESEEEERGPPLIERVWRAARCRLPEAVKQQRSRRTSAQIRPARMKDKPAIAAICAQLGEDYIPDVWEEWVSDPHGLLVVAELERQVVGIGKLTRLSESEWWLEGLRVDPAHHRQGIARRLQAHLLERANQVGRGALRFGTHSSNEPIQHLAACDGFQHVATFQRHRADPLSEAQGTPVLRPLTESDLPAAWALTNRSLRYQAASGLYEDHWTWRDLTAERLAHHLNGGEAWGLAGPEGEELAAIALIYLTGEDILHIAYVDGATHAGLVEILRGLRRMAATQARSEIRIKNVDEPSLITALDSAGYEPYRDEDLGIFELQLQPEPEPAGKPKEQ
jgi:predicted PurR-regulated permease PerM/ribosomal protein S18 acetylase RimI-like enzyme